MHFAFYHGDDRATAERLAAEGASVWGLSEAHVCGRFTLVAPAGAQSQDLCRFGGGIGAISGYVRSEAVSRACETTSPPEIAHNSRFFAALCRDTRWPLPGEWTGSFAVVGHSQATDETFVCNDPIGYLPLYLALTPLGLLGSTSLIVLGRSLQAPLDLTGLLQRLTSPFCTYGRRTLLRGVTRLLPGELVNWRRPPHGRVQTMFDDSLCSTVLRSPPRELAETVWGRLREEVRLATIGESEVCVAISGGWDSRLMLPAIREGTAIQCYTYGSEDLYESRVAALCAAAVGASHDCFPIEGRYFPGREWLEALVRQTEAANYMQWNGILERGAASGERKILLLGDLCEAIDGRNMAELSSRGARRRSFARSLLGKGDEVLESSPAAFTGWKEATAGRIVAATLRNAERLSPALRDLFRAEAVEAETGEDLAVSFGRVEANRPPFRPVFDELFKWFHRTRFLIASQILMLNSAFRALSPGTAMGFVRLISTVHPASRMRRRLMDEIAKLPDFDRLAHIPSAQIPWLSSRSPAFFREIVWGARSGTDQLLTRLRMSRKDAAGRQRVLPSLDYVKEYQREKTLERVREWFSGRWCSGEPYARMVQERAAFVSWPWINVDVVAPANVSLMLDLSGVG